MRPKQMGQSLGPCLASEGVLSSLKKPFLQLEDERTVWLDVPAPI